MPPAEATPATPGHSAGHNRGVVNWIVSVYDVTTEQLIAEHDLRPPERADVRKKWSLPPRSPIGELLVTADKLPFINALLDTPLILQDGQEAYLGEFAEYDGETVDD